MSSSNASTSTTPSPGSDAFLDSLLSMVNQEDMVAVLGAQSQMLDRFEKTNEMLSNFNRLSARRYEKTIEQFREHTDTLLAMKRDLDSVFRRIRSLKKKLATDYPQAFVAALEDIVPPDLDEDEEAPGGSGSSPSINPQQPHPSQQPLPPPHLQHPQQQQQQHHQQPPHQQAKQPLQQEHHHHQQQHRPQGGIKNRAAVPGPSNITSQSQRRSWMGESEPKSPKRKEKDAGAS